jgi:hypothetical protein
MFVFTSEAGIFLDIFRCKPDTSGPRCHLYHPRKQAAKPSQASITPVIIAVVVVMCILVAILLFIVIRKRRLVCLKIVKILKICFTSCSEALI